MDIDGSAVERYFYDGKSRILRDNWNGYGVGIYGNVKYYPPKEDGQYDKNNYMIDYYSEDRSGNYYFVRVYPAWL